MDFTSVAATLMAPQASEFRNNNGTLTETEMEREKGKRRESVLLNLISMMIGYCVYCVVSHIAQTQYSASLWVS